MSLSIMQARLNQPVPFKQEMDEIAQLQEESARIEKN
jgi:hypothetical protein